MTASTRPDRRRRVARGICEQPNGRYAEAADRWLVNFEAKVAAREPRDRTLDLYRSQLHSTRFESFARPRESEWAPF
jgi:hypothetical protein